MRKLKWIAILSLAASAYYWYGWYDSDELEINLSQTFNSLTDAISGMGKSQSASDGYNETEVFSYQDNNGQWHFSDKPIGDRGASSDSTIYRSDTNVIAPIKSPNPDKGIKSTTINDIPVTHSPLSIYTNPEKAKRLINDAQQLQERLDQRKETMDKVIDGQ